MSMSICTIMGKFRDYLNSTNYAPKTRSSYQARIKAFLGFASRRGCYLYTEDIGSSFLKEVYLINDFTARHLTPCKGNAIIFVRKLNSILAGKHIPKHYGKSYYWQCPAQFALFVSSFKADYFMHSNSDFTWDRFLRLCIDFFDLADRMGAKGCNDITQKIIDAYFIGKRGRSRLSNATDSFRLRRMFRFMHKQGFSQKDLSPLCPRVIVYQRASMPSRWSENDIDTLLGAIPHNTKVAKRDFAIILLALQCGLRSSDIKNLKLENLRWAKEPKQCRIEFRQHKTGVQISNPMPYSTSCALVDYLRNGRPETTCRNVFVTHQAPIGPIEQIASIIYKYIHRAGIMIKTQHRGLHSLRHTFASRMIARKVPLKVVSESLGHTSTVPTSAYIAVDFKGLRECALDPEGV